MEPQNAVERPEVVREEHLDYLDGLREAGVTNMYGAGAYLEGQFPELASDHPSSFHSGKAAGAVLAYWMKTFAKRHNKTT